MFSLVGGQHVDMPSDSRDLGGRGGGHKNILHIEMKSYPPAPASLSVDDRSKSLFEVNKS